MNIAQLLREQALLRPNVPALIDTQEGRDRITTFAQLEEAAARGAALLLAEGLRPGDTVLVFQPMSAELYIALLALFRAGMTALFLDPAAGREHLERCCAIRPPAGLIAAPKAHLLRLVSPALRRIPRLFAFGRLIPGAVPWSRADTLPPHDRIATCGADTPALITFTSGSTGLPKGVVRSHGFLLAQHRVLERTLELTPGTVDLATLPVFALANLASGVTSLIPHADLRTPGRIEASPVLSQIHRHHPVTTVASPAFLDRVVEGGKSGGGIPGFRTIFTGGAPIFPDRLDAFAAAFTGAEAVAVYGSSEAEPIAHVSRSDISPDDLAAMWDGAGLLAGRPVAEIRVRIMPSRWGEPLPEMDEREFQGGCLPAGSPGEIVVTGGHVLTGYLNGTGDEETKFRVDGTVWHRTGDCGYCDQRGRLWLLGRAGAVIRDDRGTLYPFAVECAARQTHGVRCAALLGRILFVEAHRGDRLHLDTLRARLAWAELDEIRQVPQIPLDRRHNAKVDYVRLKQMA